MKITNLIGREILDSRGNPTVECEMFLEDGTSVVASAPSGASTGSKEAHELRDKDNSRYLGKGVLKAVESINTLIRESLVGMEVDIKAIDDELIRLDGTSNKYHLGANAIVATSVCALKAIAHIQKKEIFELFGGKTLPYPMMNIVNGGAHADNSLDIQEFMIVPKQTTFRERLRCGSEVFHNLKSILKSKGLVTSVGDEGGFAPNLSSNYEALNLIVEAIEKAGYKPSVDVGIALDVAASSFYNKETDTYHIDGKDIKGSELINYYENMIINYPIISIEDAFDENDEENMIEFTKKYRDKIMLVGDDFFVTNKECLQHGIDVGMCNSILLKLNQIGTVSETLETINLAKSNNYKTIISHRSGETEDTTIADLAVGLDLGFIKTGSLSRGERINKYNRLLRIEEKLNK